MKQSLEKSLSNREIIRALGGRCLLLTHGDLDKVTSMGAYGGEKFWREEVPMVTLYEHRPDYGHWVVLLKTILPGGEPTVELFDSYGTLPDSQRIEGGLEAINDPSYNKAMTRLLFELSKAGIAPSYNHYKFQSKEKGINTCGRWILARSIFSWIPLDTFAELFPPGSDELVTLFTEEYLD
jgi:hypothetical protein